MPPRLPEATTLREISYQASRLSTRLRVRLPTTAASPALTLIDPVFSNIGKTGPFPQAWASLILAIVAIFVTTPVFVGPRPSQGPGGGLPPPPSPPPPPELPYPASGHACLALSSLLSLFELPCDYKLTVVQYFYRHGERIRLNSKFASQIAEQRDREFEEDEKKNVPDEHIERTGDDAEFNRGGAEQGQGQG